MYKGYGNVRVTAITDVSENMLASSLEDFMRNHNVIDYRLMPGKDDLVSGDMKIDTCIAIVTWREE